MRKPAFCILEAKGTDQLRDKCAADQCLSYRYIDSTIPLLPKSKISSLKLSFVSVQAGLCQICSETLNTGFLAMPRVCLFGSLIV